MNDDGDEDDDDYMRLATGATAKRSCPRTTYNVQRTQTSTPWAYILPMSLSSGAWLLREMTAESIGCWMCTELCKEIEWLAAAAGCSCNSHACQFACPNTDSHEYLGATVSMRNF